MVIPTGPILPSGPMPREGPRTCTGSARMGVGALSGCRDLGTAHMFRVPGRAMDRCWHFTRTLKGTRTFGSSTSSKKDDPIPADAVRRGRADVSLLMDA